MSTDLAGSGLAYGSPSVALARTTATTERPSSATPSPPALVQLPFSMCQASTASWPARFTSEFAKHGPVYTSALRASMYFPVICAALLVVAPAARAGSRKKRRETTNTFRNFIAVPPQQDRRYSPTPPAAFQDFPSGDSTSSNEEELRAGVRASVEALTCFDLPPFPAQGCT